MNILNTQLESDALFIGLRVGGQVLYRRYFYRQFQVLCLIFFTFFSADLRCNLGLFFSSNRYLISLFGAMIGLPMILKWMPMHSLNLQFDVESAAIDGMAFSMIRGDFS